MEIIAILVTVALNVALVFSKNCDTNDQCSCDFDDGTGKVDLTTLGNIDNTPRFKDVLYSPDNNYYSYNPCGGFNEGSGCSYAAACQINSDKTQQLQIGNANLSSTAFMYDDASGNTKVSYTAGSGVLHLTEVILVCDPNACDPVFTPQGQPATFHYIMQLTTICACPGKCSSTGAPECEKSGNSGGSLGAGSIFLIVLFSLIFLYLIVGSLYMKFVRKAEGTEIIPNSAFWCAVPSHVKGGVMFLVNKLTGRSRATYEEA